MKKYFSSRIFQKALAALTGGFLVLFLIGHLAGNLQLFIPGELGQKQFNAYALFMTTNPAVIALSYVTYTSIFLHLVFTLYLTLQSRKARPVKYLAKSGSTNSTWSSRNMAFLGTMLLLFLIIHLRSFWYEMHFGDIGIDKWGNKDLHTVTVTAFKNIFYTGFYIISMIMLAFHLHHGVESAFQTLGLNTLKYERTISFLGKGIAVFIPLIFATIPIMLYVR
jgi:succinate dehydrogenase / fumarate reductase cytochrome b subunit